MERNDGIGFIRKLPSICDKWLLHRIVYWKSLGIVNYLFPDIHTSDYTEFIF